MARESFPAPEIQTNPSSNDLGHDTWSVKNFWLVPNARGKRSLLSNVLRSEVVPISLVTSRSDLLRTVLNCLQTSPADIQIPASAELVMPQRACFYSCIFPSPAKKVSKYLTSTREKAGWHKTRSLALYFPVSASQVYQADLVVRSFEPMEERLDARESS